MFGKKGYCYALVAVYSMGVGENLPFVQGTKGKGGDECTHTVLRIIKEIMWMADGALVVRIHSDEGGEFRNNIMEKVTDNLGIFRTRTEGYDPKANGKSERYIGLIKHDATMKMMEKDMPMPSWYWAMRQCACKYRWAKRMIKIPEGAPDFGERVMIRRTKADQLPSFEPKVADGIF